MSTQLIKAEDFGLEQKVGAGLAEGLTVTRAEKQELIKTYAEVIKMDVSGNAHIFKELRLRIRDNRTKGTDVWHTKQKAVFLHGGRFVDAIKNADNEINLSMEAKLLEGEKHEENLEKERIENIRLDRVKKLKSIDVEEMPLGLGEMSEDSYNAILTGYKTMHAAKIAEELEAEEARVETERIERLKRHRDSKIKPYYDFFKDENSIDGTVHVGELTEDEFIKLLNNAKDEKQRYLDKQAEIALENERLKKEAEAKEAQQEKERKQREAEALIERKEQEAKEAKIAAANLAAQNAQREANKKLQDEIDAKNKAEEDRIAKETEEAELLLRAGDDGQFKMCIGSLNAAKITISLKSAKGKKKAKGVNELIEKVINYINN